MDAATDDQDRETALDFADLAVSLRILSDGQPSVPAAEVAATLDALDAAESP